MRDLKRIIRITTIGLCYMVLVSNCLVARLTAKYAVTAGISDVAGVAGFYMEVQPVSEAGGLHYSDDSLASSASDILTNAVYAFKVTGNSEVAVRYSLSINMIHANGTALTDNQWRELEPTVQIQSSREELPFGGIQIAQDGKSCSYTMKTDDWIEISPLDDYEEIYELSIIDGNSIDSDKIQIEIFIDAEQID